jgi:hypothetical protein
LIDFVERKKAPKKGREKKGNKGQGGPKKSRQAQKNPTKVGHKEEREPLKTEASTSSMKQIN